MPAENRAAAPARIAAVVVTYNRKGLLEETLRAVVGQTLPPNEVVVVDNASSDGSCDMVREKFGGVVTHLRLSENSGSAGGFHQGIRLAFEKGYDWIWVMDDDAEPTPDALLQLVMCPDFRSPDVGALACLVRDHALRIQPAHHRNCDRLLRAVLVLRPDSCPGGSFEVETSSFVGLLISRRAVSLVGLPLKEFFIWYDDTEYTYRISRKLRIVVVPASTIIHKDHLKSPGADGPARAALTPDQSLWKTYYGHRNSIYFGRKNTAGLVGVLSRLGNLEMTARYVVGALLHGDRKWARVKVAVLALADGWSGRLKPRYLPPAAASLPAPAAAQPEE